MPDAKEEAETAGRGSVVGALNKLANAAMRFILGSPLHAVVSRSTMLVTVTGRRSGQTYTTPVNYVREGDTVTVFSWRDRTWWRNLRGGASVMLRLRGRDLRGTGEVTAVGGEAVAAALTRLRPRLSADTASRLARDGVMIRITLAEGDV